MTGPVAGPPDASAADPLTRELAAQGHRVVFTTGGGEPSLVVVGGQLRGYARTGRTGDATATELMIGQTPERRPFLAEGLGVEVATPARIVLLHARGDREWFSVIEAPLADPSASAPPWRVRLYERSGGRGKLLASHDSYGHRASTQIRYPYAQNGEVAIVQLGASLYAVVGGRVLVLDGPGADARRFQESGDPHCPPGKRCFPLPAEIDVKQLLGYSPSGRTFVMAGEGDIRRRDTATGATISSRYQNFFYTGLVEEDAVVLAHAGEPPFVKRWSTPTGGQTGAEQLLVEGPMHVQLARATDGTVYGVTAEGSLARIADGRATPVVRLPAGHKVVAAAAGDKLAFVVASDAAPPVHTVVVADR